MKILAIETSCDETALAILDARGAFGEKSDPRFMLLGEALISQIDVHQEFGGVFPALAKREHSKNLIPLLQKVLKEAGMFRKKTRVSRAAYVRDAEKITAILAREPFLLEQFLETVPTLKKPSLDAIAVTFGPGLEPALWVGINFAKALAEVWHVPIIPVNHMHGHIAAGLFSIKKISFEKKRPPKNQKTVFPVLALLISGGHTELVLMKDWMQFEIIGETRDDAAGEAFDKVARMLCLPYPGGPQISALAKRARLKKQTSPEQPETSNQLPRPMLRSNDFDFSFSGLKTAVLYALRKIKNITQEHKEVFARELEDAITEVLTTKTKKALIHFSAKTLVIGGGVSANTNIRRTFKRMLEKEFPDVTLRIPEKNLSTDNAIMIALAGYSVLSGNINLLTQTPDITAKGNVRLS